MKAKLFFSLILIFVTTILAAESGEYPASDEWFSIGIEQYGEPVEIKNNRVMLEKAPFKLLIIMRNKIGVLVNFSESDNIFKGFLKDKSMDEILSQPDQFMGIGEYPLNPDEMILVDDIAPHYLFYSDNSNHRYSLVQFKDGYIIGRRNISNFTTYAAEFASTPIEELKTDVLYLSFLHSEYDENYNRIELQKEALKFIFE